MKKLSVLESDSSVMKGALHQKTAPPWHLLWNPVNVSLAARCDADGGAALRLLGAMKPSSCEWWSLLAAVAE